MADDLSHILPVLILISVFYLPSSGQYNPGAVSINNDCNSCQYSLQYLSFRERRYCCRYGFLQCCPLSQLNRPDYPEERPEYPIVDIPSSGPGPDPYRNQYPKEPGFTQPDNIYRKPGTGGYMPSGQSGQGLLRPDPEEEIRPDPEEEIKPGSMEGSRPNNYGSQPESTGYQQPGRYPGPSSSQFPPPSRHNPSLINPDNQEVHRPYQQPSYNHYRPNYHQPSPINQRPANSNRFGSWSSNPLIQGIVAPILSSLFQQNPSNQNNPDPSSLAYDDNSDGKKVSETLKHGNEKTTSTEPTSSAYQGEGQGGHRNSDADRINKDNYGNKRNIIHFQGERLNISEISELNANNSGNNGVTFRHDDRLKTQPTRSLEQSNQNETTQATKLQISPTVTPTLS
ncbi:uncharacterized protein LOC107365685 [Tetranychus urticae]|uniref:Uncharacterized protein n=1 Tax=Tetranychus urticae TaxID=32264 RepID=T1KMK5_TETUR|nr:uncharacterized protein LOC107365685 [Tetranychus urticae]